MTTQQDTTPEYVIHPAHGLGRVTGTECMEVAQAQLEVSVISFDRSKLTLRIPTTRLEKDGVRAPATTDDISKMLKRLATPSKVRHSEQYRLIPTFEEKINSGDLLAIASVARDLYRSESIRETPFSVENTFQIAVGRLCEEMALVMEISDTQAYDQIMACLTDERPSPL